MDIHHAFKIFECDAFQPEQLFAELFIDTYGHKIGEGLVLSKLCLGGRRWTEADLERCKLQVSDSWTELALGIRPLKELAFKYLLQAVEADPTWVCVDIETLRFFKTSLRLNSVLFLVSLWVLILNYSTFPKLIWGKAGMKCAKGDLSFREWIATFSVHHIGRYLMWFCSSVNPSVIKLLKRAAEPFHYLKKKFHRLAPLLWPFRSPMIG